MNAHSTTAYEHGYLTACAGQPREVPLPVAEGYPDRSGEWLAGYDDAESDDGLTRVRVVARFGLEPA